MKWKVLIEADNTMMFDISEDEAIRIIRRYNLAGTQPTDCFVNFYFTAE